MSGENTVQMIGVSGPTAARISRKASSCSPRAPARGSAGSSEARSDAPAAGARVTVKGTARSREGVYSSPHASAKHCARDCGLR